MAVLVAIIDASRFEAVGIGISVVSFVSLFTPVHISSLDIWCSSNCTNWGQCFFCFENLEDIRRREERICCYFCNLTEWAIKPLYTVHCLILLAAGREREREQLEEKFAIIIF